MHIHWLFSVFCSWFCLSCLFSAVTKINDVFYETWSRCNSHTSDLISMSMTRFFRECLFTINMPFLCNQGNMFPGFNRLSFSKFLFAKILYEFYKKIHSRLRRSMTWIFFPPTENIRGTLEAETESMKHYCLILDKA